MSASSAPFADSSTVEDACRWLSVDRPELDAVAHRLRHLRRVHHDLIQVIDVLRHHALAQLGEMADRPFVVSAENGDEEPF